MSFLTILGGLQRHMETNHIKNCSSVCHLCGKAFMVACYLTKHLRTHSDERPFKCDFDDCTLAFARKDKLQRHRNTHVGERKHVCQECGKSYFHRYDLTIHMRTHVSYKQPVHIIIYDTLSNLNGLLFFQTGDRPYECTVCQKRFTSPRALTLHLRNHQ